MTNFFDVMSRFSDVIGILGAFFALMAWLSASSIKKKLREGVKELEGMDKNYTGFFESCKGVKTEKPFALAISLSERIQSIKPDVAAFLAAKKWDMPIVEIVRNKDIVPADMDGYIKELLQKRWELETKGATEIHLFINAPIQAATLVGAMFDHWKPVKLYQRNNRTCQYEYWGPLIK